MINILPPEVKEQLQYSRYNSVLLRYAVLLFMVVGLLAATLWITHIYADRQIDDYRAVLNEREEELKRFDSLQDEVELLDKRLTTISKLYRQQTRFSALLRDMAAVLPQGTYINSIVLTGEADQPVQLLITANSFSQAGVIKNALATSDRIESVDIQSISQGSDGYSVSVVMAFSEDGAR